MRRCRQCREYVIHPDAPPTQFVCGIPCSIAYAKKLFQRKQAKTQTAWKDKVKNYRMKDKSRHLELTQKAVNRLCNLLDKGRPCISCGRPDGGGRKRNASHLKSVGANSGLRFDLRNIHGACVVCNQYQSGNLVGFRAGLLERYGQRMLDYIESAPRLKDWDVEELARIRKEAAAECRRLESGQQPSKDWRAA